MAGWGGCTGKMRKEGGALAGWERADKRGGDDEGDKGGSGGGMVAGMDIWKHGSMEERATESL